MTDEQTPPELPENPQGSPGAEQQPAPEAPPASEQPQTGQYQPVYYPPQKRNNDSAIASIIVACSSIGVLILTAGLLAPLTAIGSGVAVYLGHRGKKNVDEGKVDVQRDLAIGGFWTGIGGIILALLAIIAWIIIVAVIVSEHVYWDEYRDEFRWE